jgi:hypothetical protein
VTALATVGAAEMAALSLPELEAVIERGQQTFIEVGLALKAISEGRRYQDAGYASFEDYCSSRWGWGRRSGYFYIAAAEVAVNVNSSSQSAPSFTQARELAALPAAEQRAVASEVDFSKTTVRQLKDEVKRRSSVRYEPVKEDPAVDAEYVETEVDGAADLVEKATELLAQIDESRQRIQRRVETARRLSPSGAYELVRQLNTALEWMHGAQKAVREAAA